MKFHKLTIHNIASIEEAVIDFDRQPLAGSDVFLITGRTGSGKTTILDAVSLALYGKTSRMANSRMEGRVADGNDAGKEEDTDINDVRQMLRRGTARGFVKLLFTSGGNRYEVEWGVRRSRDKVDGKLQSYSWQLTNLGNGTSLTKVADIRNEVERIVGLTFDQFCRTTMLAQGDFARFLNSKDEEKSEILEKITGTSVYTRIGQRLAELTNRKKRDAELADATLAGISMLDDAQKERLLADRNAKNACREAAEGQKRDADARMLWLTQYLELTDQVAKAEKELDQVNETLRSEAYTLKTRTVTQWNATADQRLWLAEARKAEADARRQLRALADCRRAWQRHDDVLRQKRKDLDTQQVQLDELNGRIAAEEHRRNIYDNEKAIAVLLEALATNLEELRQHGIAKERMEKNIADIRTRLSQAVAGEEKAKNALQQCRNAIAEAETAVKNAEADKLRNSLAQCQKKEVEVRAAMADAKVCLTEERHIEDCNADIKKIDGDIDSLAALIQSRQKECTDAENQAEQCRKVLEKFEDTAGKWAVAMRSKLSDGDCCPVCGQRVCVDGFPHEEVLRNAVEEARNECKEADKQLEKIKKAISNDKGLLEAQSKQRETMRQKLEGDVKTHAGNIERLHGVVVALGTPDGWRADGDNVQTLLDNLEALLDAVEKETGSLGKAIESVKPLEESLAALREEEKKLVKEHDKARQTVSDERERNALEEKNIAVEQEAMSTRENNIATTRVELAAKLAVEADDSRIADNDPAALRTLKAKIVTAAGNYRDMQERSATLAVKIKDDLAAMEKMELPHEEAGRILGQMEPALLRAADGAAEEHGGSQRPVTVQELLAAVSSANTMFAEAVKRADDSNERLKAYYAEADSLDAERLSELATMTAEGVKKLSDEAEAIRKRADLCNGACLQSRNALDAHRGLFRQNFEAEDVDALYAAVTGNPQERLLAEKGQVSQLNETIGELNRQIGAIDQTFKQDAERLGQYQSQLEESRRLHEIHGRWERLNKLIGDAKGKTFRNIAQSYVLANLIHAANGYMAMLSDRYRLHVQSGSFVIFVRDTYISDSLRAASTLSGGESFLVSLALALALSDIGQQLAVDTLFIDEGFGTLSGEPLQKAIDTLRSLHLKTGRHVGIISHVEELRERIPVQIRVSQEAGSSKSVIAVVPSVSQG